MAKQCGFGSRQYFADTFKHATGMTPTQYRNHSSELSHAESEAWKDIQLRSEEELLRIAAFTKDNDR